MVSFGTWHPVFGTILLGGNSDQLVVLGRQHAVASMRSWTSTSQCVVQWVDGSWRLRTTGMHPTLLVRGSDSMLIWGTKSMGCCPEEKLPEGQIQECVALHDKDEIGLQGGVSKELLEFHIVPQEDSDPTMSQFAHDTGYCEGRGEASPKVADSVHQNRIAIVAATDKTSDQPAMARPAALVLAWSCCAGPRASHPALLPCWLASLPAALPIHAIPGKYPAARLAQDP